MVDIRKPERIDNQIRRILILDSEENNRNSTSVCVTYRFGDRHMCLPESIPNSEPSPPASYVAVDDIEKSKNLGPADITVVLEIVSEGENINSHRLSPESIITDPHKMSRTIQRTSPVTNTILKGFINFHMKSRFPEMCLLSNKSLPIKTTNNRHMDKIPVCIVEKMVDIRKPKRIDNQIRRIFILDSEENNGNGISVCVTYRFGDRHICFPESILNSAPSPPASCVVMDDIGQSENLGPVDLIVVLDIINERDTQAIVRSHKHSYIPQI